MKKIIIGIIAAVAVIGCGAYLLFGRSNVSTKDLQADKSTNDIVSALKEIGKIEEISDGYTSQEEAPDTVAAAHGADYYVTAKIDGKLYYGAVIDDTVQVWESKTYDGTEQEADKAQYAGNIIASLTPIEGFNGDVEVTILAKGETDEAAETGDYPDYQYETLTLSPENNYTASLNAQDGDCYIYEYKIEGDEIGRYYLEIRDIGDNLLMASSDKQQIHIDMKDTEDLNNENVEQTATEEQSASVDESGLEPGTQDRENENLDSEMMVEAE